jgi:alkylation response protein AidB-like acyl-CoA dehydrogenase
MFSSVLGGVRRDATFDEEHDAFRESFRAYVARELLPHHERWDHEGIVPRDVFAKAGAAGFLAFQAPEEFGGAGVEDFRFNAVIAEELQYAGVTAAGNHFALHNDICLPYFLELCTPEQQRRWLPGLCSGELLPAVAMTEPGAGSDLAAIATRATEDGDGYRLNGTKTFITSGLNADLVIVVAVTDPRAGRRGMSLLVVERGTPGFERGRNLEKVGQHAQDTAELFFEDVHVPRCNLLGEENAAFGYLIANLAQERLSIAVSAVAGAVAGVQWTAAHVRERTAFGAPLGALQSVRISVAEMATEVTVARAFVDECLRDYVAGRLTAERAAMAKWWTTELQGRVIDRGVQLHGGYGYMLEYPIARAWADARITRIYGGANEVMKDLIGRSLQLG